jgi:flagellar export protein FliJ
MPSPAWRTSPGIVELPKFIFSLETLLRHREDIEQRERDELLRVTYNHQLEVGNRERLAKKIQDTVNEIALRYAENRIDEELTWSYLYIDRLSREIRESEKRIAQLQSAVQAQKEVVLEASKKKKTLASMRSKQEKEFFAALEKLEQKEIDELVATRHATPDSRQQRPA